MPNFIEITCQSACARHFRKALPYTWDLNIYRGCEHRCKYCYALYSHAYLGSNSFFEDIYVKVNIVEQLERLLSSRTWKRELINIGSVCDSYQPIEAKYKLMPDILALLIKYKTPCLISTKSDLILRDFDLISKLSRVAGVNIAATITCMNEDIRQKIEAQASSSLDRFAILKAFSNSKVIRGVHCMPIIPYLTDDQENLDLLFSNAKLSQVNYLVAGTLYLRGQTRLHFFDFIKREYPQLYPRLWQHYSSKQEKVAYKLKFFPILKRLVQKYQLSLNYKKPIADRMQELQPRQYSLLDFQ